MQAQELGKVIELKNNNFQKNLANLPVLYSLQDFCDYLGISKNTAYELINTGQLKTKKVGRAYKITKTAIVEFIKTIES